MSSQNFSLLLGSTLSLGSVQLEKKAETQAIKWQENSHTLLLSECIGVSQNSLFAH